MQPRCAVHAQSRQCVRSMLCRWNTQRSEKGQYMRSVPCTRSRHQRALPLKRRGKDLEGASGVELKVQESASPRTSSARA